MMQSRTTNYPKKDKSEQGKKKKQEKTTHSITYLSEKFATSVRLQGRNKQQEIQESSEEGEPQTEGIAANTKGV